MTTAQIVAIIIAVASSGTIGAIINGILTHRKGVRDTDLARDQSAVDGFQKLNADLRTDLERLRADRALDEKQLEAAEEQVEQTRGLYWVAVRYIRALLAWIERHLPDQHPPPAPPDLAPDIHDHRKDPPS